MRDGKHSVTDGTQIYAATCSVIRSYPTRPIRVPIRIHPCFISNSNLHQPFARVIKEQRQIKGRGEKKIRACANSMREFVYSRETFQFSSPAMARLYRPTG